MPLTMFLSFLILFITLVFLFVVGCDETFTKEQKVFRKLFWKRFFGLVKKECNHE